MDRSTPSSSAKKRKEETKISVDNSGVVEVDNSGAVLTKIATLYAEQLMSDINLLVGGRNYPAHRLILCATSEVFQVMLMNREWSEWRESAIELKETPQCTEVFPHFLRYFYTGQIKISQQSVLSVLSLADKYNVKDLVNLCLDFMQQHMAHAVKQGQLVSWWQYNMACGHIKVAKECQNFVKWNLEMLANTNDFGNFEPEVLISLLQQNDLVVHNEMTLYTFVTRWLEHQHKRLLAAEGQDLSEDDVKGHMKELVLATLSHIRFSMMTPRQLAELLLNPFTKNYKEFLLECMAIGMSYHSGHDDRIREIFNTSEGKYLFTPRLYTEDKWSCMLNIENFNSLQCYHTRTFMFSSHVAMQESACDKICEWMVDVYPKGVWFHKSFIIFWNRKYEVPESVLRTVRIAVSCCNPPQGDDDPHLRVKIGILISGVRWGIEHVTKVKECIFHFSNQQRILNIDNVLDFDELNTPIYSMPHHGLQPTDHIPSAWSRPNPNCGSCYQRDIANGAPMGVRDWASLKLSPEDLPINLIGEARDQLSIQIVIMPLSNVCCVASPEFVK